MAQWPASSPSLPACDHHHHAGRSHARSARHLSLARTRTRPRDAPIEKMAGNPARYTAAIKETNPARASRARAFGTDSINSGNVGLCSEMRRTHPHRLGEVFRPQIAALPTVARLA
jgi:hypothetical protein